MLDPQRRSPCRRLHRFWPTASGPCSTFRRRLPPRSGPSRLCSRSRTRFLAAEDGSTGAAEPAERERSELRGRCGAEHRHRPGHASGRRAPIHRADDVYLPWSVGRDRSRPSSVSALSSRAHRCCIAIRFDAGDRPVRLYPRRRRRLVRSRVPADRALPRRAPWTSVGIVLPNPRARRLPPRIDRAPPGEAPGERHTGTNARYQRDDGRG